MTTSEFQQPPDDEDVAEKIAVVGLAGRYPGASDLAQFWDNLVNGVDSLHTFTDEELIELGIPEEIYRLSNFVRRGTILPDHDKFDHALFGFSPREAAIIDPQSRVLLETVHAALEHAGYDPFAVPGEVGVFAGCNPVDYALLLGNPDPTDSLTGFDQMIGNDRDFIATRVSHRLNLKGPALNVQSACSTSLVAVHLAAQHLLDYHCSMAIAGGVSINLRQGVGYFYQQGMILSPDGICRAFDSGANGTTLGQGAGAVVLKRLSDAIADGDTIHAVIAGSALNNDGSEKISYTAPSPEGQAEVIAMAHAVAGLGGDDITYIESHGTGTKLGDPVEIAALTKAFRETTDQNQFCAIGSVKTNIGHTDAAAGITGFIKAVLAVREGVIPPSLHYSEPNEAIDFAKSPFFVADRLIDWKPTTTDLRRAGVSSFGIGGTNAHMIVEQAPNSAHVNSDTVNSDTVNSDTVNSDTVNSDTVNSDTVNSDNVPRIVMVSGKTAESADATAAEAVRWVKAGRLGADEIATLWQGRTVHPHRRSFVLDRNNADKSNAPVVRNGSAHREQPGTVWMFSGQGAQFPGMAKGLYGSFDTFTRELDRVCGLLQSAGGLELLPLLLADRDDTSAIEQLKQTEVTQPALFAIQHAMAMQLACWGIQPRAVLGHSIGEFAAAVTTGVLSVGDAAVAVVARGRLMQAMEPGAMVATRMSANQFRPYLPDGVEIATSNSTEASVAAGPFVKIELLEKRLTDEGIEFQRLATSHAFHSAAMAPASVAFAKELAKFTFSEPKIPMLSNVTGDWLTAGQSIDPEFWASQIRKTVRFDECLAKFSSRDDVLLEVGPGRSLSAFASAHSAFQKSPVTIHCIGNSREKRGGDVVALDAIGRLWTEGVTPDWSKVNQIDTWRRVPAPPSILNRTTLWAPKAKHVLAMGNPASQGNGNANDQGQPTEREPVERWCYARSWRRSGLVSPAKAPAASRVLALTSDVALTKSLADQLEDQFSEVIRVALSDKTDLTAEPMHLEAADDEGLKSLVAKLNEQGRLPEKIVNLWSVFEEAPATDLDSLQSDLARGTESLLSLARSFASASSAKKISIDVIATGAHDVLGGETVIPACGSMAGPVKVIPLEYSGIQCRLIDIPVMSNDQIAGGAIAALRLPIGEHPITAVRGRHLWVHDVEQQQLAAPSPDDVPIRDGGTYLIVGGLGGVGLSIAKHLATKFKAKIALTSRSGRPPADPDNPETTRRLERLTEIESAADRLLILKADVTSKSEMAAVVAKVENELGPIDGVIVSAAVADNAGAIHRRSREAAEAAISAKVHGAVVLAEVLPKRELDFVLLSSSIASQLYHNRFGQVGYVTSNSFVEAMADARAFNAQRVVTMAWDDWVDIGMSVRAAQNFRQDHGSDIELMDILHSFSPEDGIKLFERALASDSPTLFVSTTDLRRRVANDRFVSSPFLEQALKGNDRGVVSGDSIADAVMDVWRSLLGVEEISPDADFFDLGGDSLQVARMVDRLRRHLEIEMSLDTVFDNPTPESLIAAIEQLADSDEERVQWQSLHGPRPLIPAQRRFLERNSEHPSWFNISAVLRPQPRVTFKEFADAANFLIERHDALRTHFCHLDQPDVDGNIGWIQIVREEGLQTAVVQHVDLTASDAPPLEEVGMRWQSEFDIERGPLVRFALVELPNDEQRIFLGLHHLISDRLSLLNLLDSLDLILDEGSGESLGAISMPFSQFGAALQEYVDSPEGIEDADNWDARFAEINEDSVAAAWPCSSDNVETANRNKYAVDRKIVLTANTSDGLLRGGEGRSDEIVLLALSDALRSWTGSGRIGIDVLGHGRRNLSGADVARSTGFFLSYSPVWFSQRSSELDFAERVALLRKEINRAWTFDALSYGRPSPGTLQPRPSVLFNFVGRAIAGSEPRRITVVDEPVGSGTHPDNPRDHHLSVMVEISNDDKLVISLVYSSKCHSQTDIDQLESELRSALGRLAPEVTKGVADVSI